MQHQRVSQDSANPSLTDVSRLLLCYISGLDQRHVAPDNCPFLTEALSRFPFATLRNLPSNELFPTLVSGVDPVRHGVWGVRLAPETRRSQAFRLWAHLPNFLTTTIQGALHLSSGAFDLAAIPPRRRSRFEITRTKYKRRNRRDEALFRIGGLPTVFDVVGRTQSRYVFNSSMDPARTLLPRMCRGDHMLEVLELYSLDRYQQWNLDRPSAVRDFYGRIDTFVHALHAKCRAHDTALMIVSDHGHEPIHESIDLHAAIAAVGMPDESYTCFVEVSSARFWFHSDAARRAIGGRLAAFDHATLVGYEDMRQYGIPLHDASYGEVFLFLDPGYIFFPHDFHQGLANLWLGISDPMQRSRLRDPRHRGNHGHLPHFEAERALIALLDDRFESRAADGDMLDVAPSVLGALGFDPPATMRGRSLFAPRCVP
jgi:hypothetical protein